MKIFMTGGTGFIGSNLIPELLKKNHEVYALVRYVTNRVPYLPRDVNIIYGDIRDYFLLKKTMNDIKPEAVIHLAAMSSVAYSFKHPQEVMEVNLQGTINLAEANKTNPNLEKFLFAGSSEEYGNQNIFPIPEWADLKPNQPYAVSKVASDNYLQYLREAYGFPSVTLRPFNTYGRLNNLNFVTERIVSQMLQKKKEIILGNPEPVRDLMYVDDHINGYLTMLECEDPPYAVNFCTGVGTSIKTLVEVIKELIGYEGEILWSKSFKRPTEIFKLIGDNSLARALGWELKFSRREGLERTIEGIQVKLGI